MKKQIKIFLDDIRMPKDIYPNTKEGEWVIVRTLKDFIGFIELFGVPEFISFDNDLGDSMEEGKHAVKWIVFEKELDISNMDFKIHSANTAVREYMEGTLNNWKTFLKTGPMLK